MKRTKKIDGIKFSYYTENVYKNKSNALLNGWVVAHIKNADPRSSFTYYNVNTHTLSDLRVWGVESVFIRTCWAAVHLENDKRAFYNIATEELAKGEFDWVGELNKDGWASVRGTNGYALYNVKTETLVDDFEQVSTPDNEGWSHVRLQNHKYAFYNVKTKETKKVDFIDRSRWSLRDWWMVRLPDGKWTFYNIKTNETMNVRLDNDLPPSWAKICENSPEDFKYLPNYYFKDDSYKEILGHAKKHLANLVNDHSKTLEECEQYSNTIISMMKQKIAQEQKIIKDEQEAIQNQKDAEQKAIADEDNKRKSKKLARENLKQKTLAELDALASDVEKLESLKKQTSPELDDMKHAENVTANCQDDQNV